MDFCFFYYHGLSALHVYFTFPSADKQAQQFVHKHIKPKTKLNTIILGLFTIRKMVESHHCLQFACLAVARLQPTKLHLITIKRFGSTPWNVHSLGYRPLTLNPIKLSGVCSLLGASNYKLKTC